MQYALLQLTAAACPPINVRERCKQQDTKCFFCSRGLNVTAHPWVGGVHLTVSTPPAPWYLLSFHHHGKSLLLLQRNTFLPCILALATPVLSLRRSCWLVFAFAKCCLPPPALERLKNSGTCCLSYSCALQTERGQGGRFPLKAFLLPRLFLRCFRKETGKCERASFLWPASPVKQQHVITDPRT